jgi:hypothetical protein
MAAKFLDELVGTPFGKGSPSERGLAIREGGVETGPKSGRVKWGDSGVRGEVAPSMGEKVRGGEVGEVIFGKDWRRVWVDAVKIGRFTLTSTDPLARNGLAGGSVSSIAGAGAGAIEVAAVTCSEMREAAIPVKEADLGFPSILILILPLEEWDLDAELDNIIDPDIAPKPRPEPEEVEPGVREAETDPFILTGESSEGSSRGLHIGDPNTGRRTGV